MSTKYNKPAICYETGLNEAFIVGTKKELSNFAYYILQLINDPHESLEYHGVNTKQPNPITSLSDPMSEVVLDGILIVESEEDRRNLMNKIRVNCGDDPIDWNAHDESKV